MDFFGISFEEKCRCWLFWLNKLKDAAKCVYVFEFAAALTFICTEKTLNVLCLIN